MKNLITKSILIFMASVALFACCSCSNTENSNTTNSTSSDTSRAVTTQRYSQPEQVIEDGKDYYAIIRTSIGDITMVLFDDIAPVAVNSFVFLAEEDFYDNMIFFRNIEGFMIQTGDPNNIGNGNAGYYFDSELPVKYYYEEGIVALANAGEGTTSNGSQFFICTGEDSESLTYNPIYVQIGYVTSGLDIAKQISEMAVTTNELTGEESYPVEPVYINSIEIFVVDETD